MPARRFPFPMPFGWFQVAYPDDVSPGEVLPLRYFGRELVLWRDHGGTAHLHDAFCPHLGAHIGIGGEVEDDGTLRCPFHGWRFDADGRCAVIPYSDRVNRQARLRRYPLVERSGLVMAWYHPHDEPPSYEVPPVPEHDDPAYGPYECSSYVVRSAIQEMAENTVDRAHFGYVHGHPAVGEIEEYRLDGVEQVMLSKQVFPSSQGPVDARIDVYKTGAGFGLTRYQGLVDAALVGTSTPIDEETVHLRFSFTVRNPDGDERVGRIARAFVDSVNREVQQDITIWEHKRYRPDPALADTDGPIMQFRRWFSRFYVDPPPDADPTAEAGERDRVTG